MKIKLLNKEKTVWRYTFLQHVPWINAAVSGKPQLTDGRTPAARG